MDIRRQAMIQHLMYKAIFHLSEDRAQFLSRLFSKPLKGKDAPGRDTPLEELVGYSRPASPWHARGRCLRGKASWMANLFFFLCGLLLLWRVDRMPIEIGALGAHWKGTWEKLQELWMRRRHLPSSAHALQDSSPHRKRFGARFPLDLDDMILRDFALYLGMVLATFLILALVFTFFELLTDIVRNKVPVIMLAEYLLNLSPSLLYVMAPIAVLLAVLITFGLLEKSSELTAMKATGISIYRAALPVIVVCAIFAAAMFVFDQLYIPRTNREQEILRNQIKGKPPQTYLQADRKWTSEENNDIFYDQVFDPDTNQLGGVEPLEFDPNTFQLTRRNFAAHAHWDEGLNKWIFAQGWVRTLSGTSIQATEADVANLQQHGASAADVRTTPHRSQTHSATSSWCLSYTLRRWSGVKQHQHEASTSRRSPTSWSGSDCSPCARAAANSLSSRSVVTIASVLRESLAWSLDDPDPLAGRGLERDAERRLDRRRLVDDPAAGAPQRTQHEGDQRLTITRLDAVRTDALRVLAHDRLRYAPRPGRSTSPTAPTTPTPNANSTPNTTPTSTTTSRC